MKTYSEKTTLDGVIKIHPYVFEDYRGSYTMTYSCSTYGDLGVPTVFSEDDVSVSTRGVLRGIHTGKTDKLVCCPYGRIYLVIVNCMEGTREFGKWEGFTISGSNMIQLYVPEGYGVGHLVMSEVAVFSYKQTNQYDRSSQRTYRYDDPKFSILWPISNPILSHRDSIV